MRARVHGSVPLLLASAAAAAWSVPAHGAPPPQDEGVPRILIDDRLQERAVTLVSLDGSQIRYLDAGGLFRDEPHSAYVALVPPAGTPEPRPPSPALWLTDGQRLAGILRPGDPPDDAALWKHPVFGPLTLPLEQVARVVLRRVTTRAAARPPGDAEDSILLVNGDRLNGFVAAFGMTVRVEVGGEAREVSSRRIARADLANPPQPLVGLAVWLADGSVIRVASFRTSRAGEVTITPDFMPPEPAGTPPTLASGDAADIGRYSLADVAAVAFDAARILPLASLEPAAQTPVGERRWTEPAIRGPADAALLGAADIVLPGPMSVEWALPPGAARVSAEAELTPDLWSWGDCEIVVSVVTPRGRAAEVLRERVHADRPRVPINVPVSEPGGRLRLTVEPGRYGAIQDRIILRRPIILLDAPPG